MAEASGRIVASIASAARDFWFLHGSPVFRKIVKMVFRLNSNRPMVRSIVSGVGRGMKLQVLPQTPVSFWLGFFELETQRVVAQEVKRGCRVYDCGANIGYYSGIFAKLVGEHGMVVAFEPSPENLSCLKKIAELNGLKNITVVPKAVWRRGGIARFHRDLENKSAVTDHLEGALGDRADKGAPMEVETVSLDQYVYEEGNPIPDFIKIDVEGSEGAVLAGAKRLLSEHAPTVLIEIHFHHGRDAWELLKEINYVPVDIATMKSPETPEEFCSGINRYLCRKLRAGA